MGPEILLAMQAAGMVTDFLGTINQQRLGEMGLKISKASMEANIYQTRLETEEASLQAMKDLRKNIGSQIAVQAARGTATNAGSALALFNESVSDFSSDERMRRINQLFRENEIRAGGAIQQLNQSASNSKLWQGFASRSLNTLSTNPSVWGFGNQKKNTKSSYGLTPIGG
jgi:hypothetical protein